MVEVKIKDTFSRSFTTALFSTSHWIVVSFTVVLKSLMRLWVLESWKVALFSSWYLVISKLLLFSIATPSPPSHTMDTFSKMIAQLELTYSTALWWIGDPGWMLQSTPLLVNKYAVRNQLLFIFILFLFLHTFNVLCAQLPMQRFSGFP